MNAKNIPTAAAIASAFAAALAMSYCAGIRRA